MILACSLLLRCIRPMNMFHRTTCEQILAVDNQRTQGLAHLSWSMRIRETQLPFHQLSQDDRFEIVEYILSFDQLTFEDSLMANWIIVFKQLFGNIVPVAICIVPAPLASCQRFLVKCIIAKLTATQWVRIAAPTHHSIHWNFSVENKLDELSCEFLSHRFSTWSLMQAPQLIEMKNYVDSFWLIPQAHK